jgi:putative transposase
MGARQVCEVLERLMRERGAPAFVRSDNGPEFIARCLARMLAVKGVACTHIDPGSPWQNGKNERFNGIFRDECANRETFHQRAHARAISQLFRRYYNTARPHSSLGYQTPAEFARRHPPLGAAMFRREHPFPEAPFTRYERYPCVRSLYIRVASGMGAGQCSARISLGFSTRWTASR